MAVAFVREHGATFIKAAGTTNHQLSVLAGVPIGNVLVAVFVFDNAATASKPAISSISRAAGETNSWAFIGAARSTSTTAGAFASGEMWAIKTTVAWPASLYTITFDTTTVMKSSNAIEFSGAQTIVRSTTGTAYSTTTTAAAINSAGILPVTGDLALGFLFGSNVAAAQAGDTDTLGGSWSTPIGVGSTGSSAATNNFGIVQYKVLTSASHQTYSSSAAMTAGNGVICAILQAVPEPTLTQAAYQWFQEGTESGAVAYAAQDTAITGNISNGDATGTLRIRLQATSAQPTLATDDWQLQYLKNGEVYGIDHYTSGSVSLTATNTQVAQSFTGVQGPLTRAAFYLYKIGTPIGGSTTSAALWAHDGGAFGGTGVPTGAPLAISTNSVTNSTVSVSSSDPALYSFTFDGSVVLAPGTSYFIGLITTGVDGAGYLTTIRDFQTATHPGNMARYTTGWTAGASTEDLIFEVNTVSGTWTNVTAGVETLADSSESFTTSISVGGATSLGRGQSFKGNGQQLSRVGFLMAKLGSPSATLKAYLHAHTGTYGAVGGTGTGPQLASNTDSPLAISSLSTTATWTYFTFDGTRTLTNTTPYVVSLIASAVGDASNCAMISSNSNDATHPGIQALYEAGGWYTGSLTGDLAFRLYTSVPATTVAPYSSPNLTAGSPTTNRLTGGTGTFTPGKISENGVTADLGWPGNNYTELLYALKVIAADSVAGDSLQFRVVRNGATIGMTYTQVPRINLTKVALPQVTTSLSTTWGVRGRVTGSRTTTWNLAAQTIAEIPPDFTDATVWTHHASETVTASKLVFPPSTSVYYTSSTQRRYSWAGSRVFVKVSQVNSTRLFSMTLGVSQSATNLTDLYQVNIGGGNVYGLWDKGGTPGQTGAVTWDPAKPYIAISTVGATTSFERSATGQPGTWEVIGSTTVVNASPMLYLVLFTEPVVGAAGDVWVENLNTAAVATTQVTASRSTLWGVTAAPPVPVTASRVATWATSAYATAPRPTTYAVLARATSPAVTTYAVLARQTQSKATTYVVLAPVTATRATTYVVRSLVVVSSRSTSWSVGSSITSTRATLWVVQARVSDPISTSWAVLTPATALRPTTWTVLAAASSTRATTWVVRAQTTAARPATWNVIGLATIAQITPDFTSPAWVKVYGVTATPLDLTYVLGANSSGKAQTASPYRLAESQLFVRIAQIPSQPNGNISMFLDNYGPTYDYYEFLVYADGTTTLTYSVANVTEYLDGPAWDPAKPVISVRQTGNTFYFERSATGAPGTWEVLRTAPASPGLGAATYVYLNAISGSSGGTGRFDYLNTVAPAKVTATRDTSWAALARVPVRTRNTRWYVNGPAGPPFSTLSPDFTALTRGGTATATSTRLTLPAGAPAGNAYTPTSYSLDESRVFFKLAQPPTQGYAYAELSGTGTQADYMWEFDWQYGLNAWNRTSRISPDTAWDPAKPYLSIRESGDVVYFERSATGASGDWETVATTPLLYESNRMVLGFYHYGGNVGETWFESLNTSQVTAARAATWNTAGANVPVTASRATTWTVGTPVTAANGTSYTVLAQLSKTAATTYIVRALATALRPTTWRTLATAPASRATTWSARAAVTAARPTTWNAPAQVTANRTTNWTAAVSIALATRPTTWHVLAPITASRTTTWTAAVSIALATRPTTWAVLTPITATRPTSWAVTSRQTATRPTTWHTLVPVVAPATRATTWKALAQATNPRPTTWSVLTSLAAVSSRATSYAVRAQVTDTQPTTWNVQTQVTDTQPTTWVTRASVTANRAASWAVRYELVTAASLAIATTTTATAVRTGLAATSALAVTTSSTATVIKATAATTTALAVTTSRVAAATRTTFVAPTALAVTTAATATTSRLTAIPTTLLAVTTSLTATTTRVTTVPTTALAIITSRTATAIAGTGAVVVLPITTSFSATVTKTTTATLTSLPVITSRSAAIAKTSLVAPTALPIVTAVSAAATRTAFVSGTALAVITSRTAAAVRTSASAAAALAVTTTSAASAVRAAASTGGVLAVTTTVSAVTTRTTTVTTTTLVVTTTILAATVPGAFVSVSLAVTTSRTAAATRATFVTTTALAVTTLYVAVTTRTTVVTTTSLAVVTTRTATALRATYVTGIALAVVTARTATIALTLPAAPVTLAITTSTAASVERALLAPLVALAVLTSRFAELAVISATVRWGNVVVGEAEKQVVGQWVIIGGVKHPVTNSSVVVGEQKKALV